MDEFKKLHDRDSFYKYVPVETAKLIFTNQTLRWSNPSLFNDPFDSQSCFHSEVTVENFPLLMRARVEELAKAPQEPVFVDPLPVADMRTFVLAMRGGHKNGEIDWRKFDLLYPAFRELWGKLEADRRRYIPHWESYKKKCRVLCLACEPDNIVMWTHYAKNHHGVAFKLKVAQTAEEDDPLWLARPVDYRPKASLFADAGVVDQVLGLKPLTLFNPGDMWKPAYEKYEGWRYENEWRVVDPQDTETPEGFGDYGFALRMLEAVYFGIDCKKEDQDAIIGILKPKAPHIKYFKARRHPYDYKIEFDVVIV